MGVRVAESPVGKIYIRSKSGVVTDLLFRPIEEYPNDIDDDQEFLNEVVKKLNRYFNNDLDAIQDIPLSPSGTAFQREVWQTLKNLKHGETLSYGELARVLGKPHGARAVGQAVGKNPICVIIPCHRILGANKNLGGFSGGLFRKRFLLNHEGIAFREPAVEQQARIAAH